MREVSRRCNGEFGSYMGRLAAVERSPNFLAFCNVQLYTRDRSSVLSSHLAVWLRLKSRCCQFSSAKITA